MSEFRSETAIFLENFPSVLIAQEIYVLTDKTGIPLSAVKSPASTHDINLITDVVDNTVIRKKRHRRQRPSLHRSKIGLIRRKLRQHLCLDKAYISEQEEQELIKRGYVLHIPIKKKKGGGER